MWRDEIAQARKKENNSECRPFPGVVAVTVGYRSCLILR